MFTDLGDSTNRLGIEEKPDTSAEVTDGGKGVSEESLEGLRVEFVSLGGIVTTLPEVSSVRDFTQLVLKTGNLRELYMIVEGKWKFLRRIDSQDHIVDADGTLSDVTLKVNAILVALENNKILKAE